MRQFRCALGLILVAACQGADEPTPTVMTLMTGETEQVIPGEGLLKGLELRQANNNLDVGWHGERLFLAWRNAPSHFASAEAKIHVVSSADDGATWRHEGTFHVGSDLREPQIVSTNGELWVYFAELGTNPTAFEPKGSWRTKWLETGAWTDLETVFPENFIPWRIKPFDGGWATFGYTGGEDVYDLTGASKGAQVDVRWLVSEDGLTWGPVAGDGVVLSGGGSETDAVRLPDGDLLAIVRNEAGDETGFGSKVCRAPAEDPLNWTCVSDPKKYDSPLLWADADGAVWLIARRNVTDTGHFDLQVDGLDPQSAFLAYQYDYWQNPKRCAVWSVDPESLTVSWHEDLPSRGDTCFPEMVEHSDGSRWVYNYSSPLDGEDVSWIAGQGGPTYIYRTELRFSVVP